MAGRLRLFEKLADGTLQEVPPEEYDRRRAGRSVSVVSTVIEVLWTAEEEAARAAEERLASDGRQVSLQKDASAAIKRARAVAKLKALGLDDDDIEALK